MNIKHIIKISTFATFQQPYMDDYVFDKSTFFIIFQRFECYATLIVKELLCINKIEFFTSLSKSAVTHITLIVTNVSNNIIKQYYGVIKTFKVLVFVKKKQFSRTNILFRTGLSCLISKLSLIQGYIYNIHMPRL